MNSQARFAQNLDRDLVGRVERQNRRRRCCWAPSNFLCSPMSRIYIHVGILPSGREFRLYYFRVPSRSAFLNLLTGSVSLRHTPQHFFPSQLFSVSISNPRMHPEEFFRRPSGSLDNICDSSKSQRDQDSIVFSRWLVSFSFSGRGVTVGGHAERRQ